MTMKNDAKFKEKLTCRFKYDMKDFVQLSSNHSKFQNFTLMGSFRPKYIRFELKNTETLSFMKLISDAKLEQSLTLWFQK